MTGLLSVRGARDSRGRACRASILALRRRARRRRIGPEARRGDLPLLALADQDIKPSLEWKSFAHGPLFFVCEWLVLTPDRSHSPLSRFHPSDRGHGGPAILYLRRFHLTMALPPEAPAAFIVVNSSPLTLMTRFWSCPV